jgi:16S rRNA (guanine966-N2)-methyltransferase
MRITGGEFRGRNIVALPKGISGVRPSMDMVREAVFSMLDGLIEINEVSVLDLYAGSGAYGFESLSRGAFNVHFVEKRKICADAIIKTSKNLSVTERCKIEIRSVETYLKVSSGIFSLVFADPPYGQVNIKDFVLSIKGAEVLSNNAILVFEYDMRNIESIDKEIENITLYGMLVLKQKSYSKSGILILKNMSNS